MILYMTEDNMVPVLRNKALKFRLYMCIKEGLYTWTFFKSAMFNLFFAIEFFAMETYPQNFAKNSTPQKNPVIRYSTKYSELKSALFENQLVNRLCAQNLSGDLCIESFLL